jgi:diguanylate cyclase (GGDEF)-like protein
MSEAGMIQGRFMTTHEDGVPFGCDRLTGLATIHVLMALEAEIDARCRAHGQSDGYGIVLIDIEGFRAINQDYGFDVGDELLVQIARRLEASLSEPPPPCIARIGGDEFAVLFDVVEARTSPSQLARKIRLDIGHPFTIDDAKIRLRLRTSFRRGPNRKPVASDLLWEVQWADRIEATRELHQRLEALELRDGQFAGQAEDLRARLASAERRANLGLYDDLTGLRNRRGFKEVLPDLPGPRVVAFIDIDNLRELNGLDDQNWEAGDQALAGVATRLLATLPTDSIVTRWGGDEFLVIVPGTGVDAVAAQLEGLIERARKELRFGDVGVTFSAGLAMARGPAEQDAAQAKARNLARTAKASGRGRVDR